MNINRLRKCFTVLFVIVGGLLGCTAGADLPPLPPDATIVAFGDSLTYGTGAGGGESYPEILAALVGRSVSNAGVPGEVSAEGLARLPEVLDREKPSLIIICHGGNDFLRRLEHSETERNLRDMVQYARGKGISVVLVSVPELSLTLSPPSLYREIADREGVPLEDEVMSTILKSPSLKSDHIHPNALGYRRMAESLAKLLRSSGALP